MNSQKILLYALFWYKVIGWSCFLLGGPFIIFVGFAEEASRYRFRIIAAGIAVVCVGGPMVYRDLREEWRDLRNRER